MANAYVTNIEEKTIKNRQYRKILYTGRYMQLVVMSIKPGKVIPMEVHPFTDQFIRVEKGLAQVKVDDKVHRLKSDEIVIIPAGSMHEVRNRSRTRELKIYTIYAPPEH